MKTNGLAFKIEMSKIKVNRCHLQCPLTRGHVYCKCKTYPFPKFCLLLSKVTVATC